MACSVRFTPLCSNGSGAPLCYLLQLDGFTLLLDCGWDDAFDPALIEPVKSVVASIDAVLISHPDTAHLGALPHLVGSCGLRAPVYATIPVYRMGQMVMYDQYLSRQAVSDFNAFSLDDVDAAFAGIRQLRYMEEVRLGGKGAGIMLTPFNAGRLLGGAAWRISKGGEDVVYAVDYNHRKERALAGSMLDAWAHRPALLITDAANALAAPGPELRRRDEELRDLLLAALRRDGSVLMPTDTAGRTLELVLVLERLWQEHKLSYPLVLLTSMCSHTLAAAKVLVEFLGEDRSRKWMEDVTRNPFDCKLLRLAHSREEVDALGPGPKVVLASMASLEAGMSRQLLADWAGSPANCILFTQRSPAGTLAEALQTLQAPGPVAVKLEMSRRVPLAGQELEEHFAAQQAEAAATEAAMQQEELVAEAMGAEGPSASGAAAAAAAAAASSARSAAAAASQQPRTSFGSTTPGGGARPSSASASSQQHLYADQPMRSSSGTISRLTKEGVVTPNTPLSRASSSASAAAAVAGSASGAKRDVLIEGFSVPEGAAAPMFPDEEDDAMATEWDEWGAKLGPEEMALGPEAGAGPMAERAKEEEAEEEAPQEVPTKVVPYDATVTFNAAIRYVDFEGRADGASMRRIISRIAPRQLVLVHGEEPALLTLKHSCEADLRPLGTRVHLPGAFETTELSLAPLSRILLAPSLLARLALSQQGEYALAWLNGVLQQVDHPIAGRMLQLVPPGNAAAAAAASGGGHGGIFIGDVRLSDLKQELALAGINAEFLAGSLTCGPVTISRASQDDGHLLVQGALSDEFYKIKDLVTKQYHVC